MIRIPCRRCPSRMRGWTSGIERFQLVVDGQEGRRRKEIIGSGDEGGMKNDMHGTMLWLVSKGGIGTVYLNRSNRGSYGTRPFFFFS